MPSAADLLKLTRLKRLNKNSYLSIERPAPVLITPITTYGDTPMSAQAMKAGAVDFLTKPVTREKLLISIRAAIQKIERLLSENANHQEALLHLASITDRERLMPFCIKFTLPCSKI